MEVAFLQLLEDEVSIVSSHLVAELHLSVQPVQEGTFCELEASEVLLRGSELSSCLAAP